MKDLTKAIINDGQPFRAINTYLHEVFKEIDGVPVLDEIDFSNIDSALVSNPNHIANNSFNKPRSITALEFIDHVIEAAEIAERYYKDQEKL